MSKDEFIAEYRYLKSRGFTTQRAVEIAGAKYDDGLSYGQLLAIARTPTPEQVAKVVKKRKLVCPRCGTSEFIVGEVIGEVDGEPVNNTEYYCNNKVEGSVFTRCWYHFPLHRPNHKRVVGRLYWKGEECTV